MPARRSRDRAGLTRKIIQTEIIPSRRVRRTALARGGLLFSGYSGARRRVDFPGLATPLKRRKIPFYSVLQLPFPVGFKATFASASMRAARPFRRGIPQGRGIPPAPFRKKIPRDSAAKRLHAAKVILPPLQRGKSRSAAQGMGVFRAAAGVALRRSASRDTPPPPGLPL